MRNYLLLGVMTGSFLLTNCGELPETPVTPAEAEEDGVEGSEDYGTGGEDGGDEGFSTGERAHASLLGQWSGPCKADDYKGEYGDGTEGGMVEEYPDDLYDDYSGDDDDDSTQSSDSMTLNDEDEESNREVIHFGEEFGVREQLFFAGPGCMPENLVGRMVMQFDYAVNEEITEIPGARKVEMMPTSADIILHHKEFVAEIVAAGCSDAKMDEPIPMDEFEVCDEAARDSDDSEEEGATLVDGSEGEGNHGPEIGEKTWMAVKIDGDRLWFGDDRSGTWKIDRHDEFHRMTKVGRPDQPKDEFKDDFNQELQHGEDGEFSGDDVGAAPDDDEILD